MPSCQRKSARALVRQLRGPHLCWTRRALGQVPPVDESHESSLCGCGSSRAGVLNHAEA